MHRPGLRALKEVWNQMPTYRYRCADCGNEFDQYQKFSDDPLKDCPSCAGTVRRVIQPVGVVFKGSGWYVTDSRPKPSSNGSDAKPEKTDAASSDKPESTAESGTAKETAPAKAAESKKSTETPKVNESKVAAGS